MGSKNKVQSLVRCLYPCLLLHCPEFIVVCSTTAVPSAQLLLIGTYWEEMSQRPKFIGKNTTATVVYLECSDEYMMF